MGALGSRYGHQMLGKETAATWGSPSTGAGGCRQHTVAVLAHGGSQAPGSRRQHLPILAPVLLASDGHVPGLWAGVTGPFLAHRASVEVTDTVFLQGISPSEISLVLQEERTGWGGG